LAERGLSPQVSATKARTRGALLTGLRNGDLAAAVDKMEGDVAAEEVQARGHRLRRGESSSSSSDDAQATDSMEVE
jgi:hypothetical protein